MHMRDLWEYAKTHKLLVFGGLGGLILFIIIYKYMKGSAPAPVDDTAALLAAGVPTTTQVQEQEASDQAALAANQQQEQESLAASQIGAQEQEVTQQAQVAEQGQSDQLTTNLAELQTLLSGQQTNAATTIATTNANNANQDYLAQLTLANNQFIGQNQDYQQQLAEDYSLMAAGLSEEPSPLAQYPNISGGVSISPAPGPVSLPASNGLALFTLPTAAANSNSASTNNPAMIGG